MSQQIVTAEELGATIRLLRTDKGWTQADLAGRARVSRQFVIKLEAGHRGAELGRILAVGTALGVAITLVERAKDVAGDVDLDSLFGG